MLRLPNPDRGFKITRVDAFIANNGGPKIFLLHFTDSLSGVKPSSFWFDIGILKETLESLLGFLQKLLDKSPQKPFLGILYIFFIKP